MGSNLRHLRGGERSRPLLLLETVDPMHHGRSPLMTVKLQVGVLNWMVLPKVRNDLNHQSRQVRAMICVIEFRSAIERSRSVTFKLVAHEMNIHSVHASR